MKVQCKNLQLAGIDVVLPAVLAIEGRQPDTAKRINVIVGFAAGGAESVVPVLAGQWLSQLCRRHFVETGKIANDDLASVAFYDKLARAFPADTPFVAALVAEARSSSVANGDILSKLTGGTAELARWKYCGQVRAYVNPAMGLAQLTFDNLLGGITLATRNGFAASVSRAFKQCHEVSAWYGFGLPMREPAEAIARLRDEFVDPRRSWTIGRAPAHA